MWARSSLIRVARPHSASSLPNIRTTRRARPATARSTRRVLHSTVSILREDCEPSTARPRGKPVKETFFEESHLNEVKYRQGVDVDSRGVTANGKVLQPQRSQADRAPTARLHRAQAGCEADRVLHEQATEPGGILALDSLVLLVKKQTYGLRSLFHESVQSEFFLTK